MRYDYKLTLQDVRDAGQRGEPVSASCVEWVEASRVFWTWVRNFKTLGPLEIMFVIRVVNDEHKEQISLIPDANQFPEA